MADKGIPFDVPTRANLLQGQRLIDEQLREKSARDAKLSPLDKAYAALEAARTFGSGILATVGSLPTRAIKGEDAAQEYINQRMYIPTTEKGMDYVGNVGNFLEQLETKYKLPPVLPEAVALQNVMGPAAKQATKQAAKAAKPVVGQALEDYMFKQGLAMPVVKPKGGNWRGNLGIVRDQLIRGQDAAIQNWVDSNLTNYVKKQMATPDDPVRKLADEGISHLPESFLTDRQFAPTHVRRERREAGFPEEGMATTPMGKGWESIADQSIFGRKVKEQTNLSRSRNPWMDKLDPEENIFEFGLEDRGGFGHIVDVLREDLAAGRIRPEQLNKVSMEQAVRRTAEYDQEMAKRMAESKIKATEGMPVYKDYGDEGYQWIELTTPKPSDVLPEGWTMLEPKNGYMRASSPDGAKVIGEDMPNLIKNLYQRHPDAPGNPRQVLEDALKYEGDTMGHCVGGYCPDVMEGRSRIFSLRDARGEPHVTVEVAPHNPNLEFMYAKQNLPDLYAKYSANRSNYFNSWPEFLKKEAPELLDATENKIVQIKGKQNAAPKKEYLPFVQDFVRSGEWSDVGDIGNTGLRQSRDVFGPTELDVLKNRGREVGKYLTPEEIAELQATFKPEGMKRGGSVHIADNPDTMMMEVEDQKFSTAGAVAKQVAKRTAKTAAKVVENKPALPLDLPRAPAKTKEQIRPIAQRMAQQMTGEFVRPDPKKSVNPAGKSLKQFQMEQGLEHDIRPTADSNLSAQQIADIEKQMGMLKIGVSGDTTIADQTLHRAGPYELDLPSPQHGGPLYGLGGEGAWASNNPVAATFQKRVQELSQAHGDAPVLGQFLAMGPSGSNFAMHFADANLRAIDTSKMSKSQINAVNDLIRAGTQKSGPRPSFSGIEDKESAYLQFAIDPELRKHFNAIMQKPDYTTKLGLPDGRVILHAITEPELRNTEILTSGLSQMRLDPSVDPSTLSLSTHPTYSHVIPKVPDSEIGKTKYLIPAEMEFPDVAEYAKKNYRPEDLTRVYQTATPRQMIDQQHIDEIRMYEEMMKELTGKKKGGAITKDKKFGIGGMAGKAVKSAVATRELEKAAKITAEMAAKKAAKDALMPQYNEAVKGMTQKQNPPSFEQWKAINYPEPEMAEGGESKPQFIPYPRTFEEYADEALEKFRNLSNQGLNAIFPLRKMVGKASSALLDDWQERTIEKDPGAYMGKHAKHQSELANFHIKNALRKKIGMNPIALPEANIEDSAVLSPFPEPRAKQMKKADGGSVNLDAMYMAVNDAKFRRK